MGERLLEAGRVLPEPGEQEELLEGCVTVAHRGETPRIEGIMP
jgi:hypothetical protein